MRAAKGDEVPYVVASRHPNSALTVATLARTSPEKGVHLPLAAVSLQANAAEVPIGIYGEFAALSVRFNHSIEGMRVWAQDLASDGAVDATGDARIEGDMRHLSGDFIKRWSQSAQTLGDQLEPGLVVQLFAE